MRAGVMALKADRAPQELWHLVRPRSIRHSWRSGTRTPQHEQLADGVDPRRLVVE